MNKIVLDHYPVSKLPEDMREGLDVSATVKVVIEEEAAGNEQQTGKDNKRLSVAETVALVNACKKDILKQPEAGEAVSRIRQLRDEWENE
jgi:hypothetical protein